MRSRRLVGVFIFVLLASVNLAGANLPAHAEKTLQASVSKTWTVEMARDEAFRQAKPIIDVSQYSSLDPNFLENQQAVKKGGGQSHGRTVTVFHQGNSIYYGVDGRFYLENGALIAVQFTVGEGYPKKVYKHAASNIFETSGIQSGQLMTVGITIRPEESFLFDAKGRLLAHWKDKNCYKDDDSFCGTRMTLPE
jgi:hypothetical protein